MIDQSSVSSLDVFENFPGFERTPGFLEDYIKLYGSRCVADIGGGANPMLPQDFIAQNGIDYTVIDLSQEELAKAPASYHKICVDITAPEQEFATALGKSRFNFIFSHMVMEHIKEPTRAYENIYRALQPGGYAVHLFPMSNSLPLMLNRILPESLTRILLRIVQPNRDVDIHALKFPAYYRMCRNPSEQFHRQLESFGFRVVRHTAYIGHDYYKSLPVIRDIERWLRPRLLRAKLPLTSYAVLLLQKPA